MGNQKNLPESPAASERTGSMEVGMSLEPEEVEAFRIFSRVVEPVGADLEEREKAARQLIVTVCRAAEKAGLAVVESNGAYGVKKKGSSSAYLLRVHRGTVEIFESRNWEPLRIAWDAVERRFVGLDHDGHVAPTPGARMPFVDAAAVIAATIGNGILGLGIR